MKTYYVYELINLMGTVEYVGETTKPKFRFYQHTKTKPKEGASVGKFYGRQDLVMNIVSDFITRKEARNFETELKLYYGLKPTERERAINNGRTKSRPVLVYKKDGTFVNEYISECDCANKLGLHKQSIYQSCHGKIKTTGGYIIKFKEI